MDYPENIIQILAAKLDDLERRVKHLEIIDRLSKVEGKEYKPMKEGTNGPTA